jgi:hypothetical protein
MPCDVKRTMLVNDVTLELASYGALAIFTTQSSAEGPEILLVHADPALEDKSVFGTTGREANCEMPELDLIKPGSEFDRFKTGSLGIGKSKNVFLALRMRRSEDPTAIGGPGFPFLSPVVTKIS